MCEGGSMFYSCCDYRLEIVIGIYYILYQSSIFVLIEQGPHKLQVDSLAEL